MIVVRLIVLAFGVIATLVLLAAGLVVIAIPLSLIVAVFMAVFGG